MKKNLLFASLTIMVVVGAYLTYYYFLHTNTNEINRNEVENATFESSSHEVLKSIFDKEVKPNLYRLNRNQIRHLDRKNENLDLVIERKNVESDDGNYYTEFVPPYITVEQEKELWKIFKLKTVSRSLEFEPAYCTSCAAYGGYVAISNSGESYINLKANIGRYLGNADFGEESDFTLAVFKDIEVFQLPHSIRSYYDFIYHYSEDYARVRKDSLFGFIDLNAKEIVEPKYIKATDFNEGISLVKDAEKSYYLKSSTLDYLKLDENLRPHSTFGENGVAIVKYLNDNVSYCLVSEYGIKLSGCHYQNIEKLDEQRYRVNHRNKEGIIDDNGETIIQTEYDNILTFDGIYFIVNIGGISEMVKTTSVSYKEVIKNGSSGVYDYNGNLIIPVEHKYYEVEELLNALLNKNY